jgi:hypothetical protein
MKTFLEFVTEAEVKWNTGTLSGSKKSPSATANEKMTKLGKQMTNPRTTPAQMSSIAKRIKRLRSVISGAGEVAKVSDPRAQSKDVGRENTKVVGYASKPRDVVSRAGSTSDVQRTDIEQEPDVITGSRYKKPGVSGGRGTNTGRSGGTYGTKKG